MDLQSFLARDTNDESSMFDNMDSISVGEARAQLSATCRFVTQYGKPVAVKDGKSGIISAVLISATRYEELIKIEAAQENNDN